MSLGGVEADYVEFSDFDTSAENWSYRLSANFSRGIPQTFFENATYNTEENYGRNETHDESTLRVWFENESAQKTYWAYIGATRFDFREIHANILANVAGESFYNASAPIDCSHAGGCRFTIAGQGLGSLLKNSLASLTVCDTPCDYINSESTYNTTVCKAPSSPTLYSNRVFGVGKIQEKLEPSSII